MNRSKLALISAFALSSLVLTAPAHAIDDPTPPPEEEPEKGDNGWGNGADTTNAGSFSGGTASSKSNNGLERNDKNYPSALDRFEGR